VLRLGAALFVSLAEEFAADESSDEGGEGSDSDKVLWLHAVFLGGGTIGAITIIVAVVGVVVAAVGVVIPAAAVVITVVVITVAGNNALVSRIKREIVVRILAAGAVCTRSGSGSITVFVFTTITVDR